MRDRPARCETVGNYDKTTEMKVISGDKLYTVARAWNSISFAELVKAILIFSAKQVVEPHKPAWTLIVKHFGQDVLLSNGNLDRPKLAACIFGDEKKRKLLNSCTHPYIQKEIMWQIFMHFIKGYKFVFLDIPLLLEGSKLLRYVNSIIVVYCEGELQLQRLMQRNSLSEEDALKRINSQMSLEKKKELADYVIENSHGIEETRQQVHRIVICLQESKSHLWLRIPFLLLLIGFIFIIIFGVKKLCL